jgi:cytochrome c-type biogenesis protein CcmH/NrfF
VHPAVLRTTLATVLIGAGIALLIKAGLGIPTWVLVPFPVGVIVLLIVTIVRESRARTAAAAQATAESARLAAQRAQPPPRAAGEELGWSASRN